MPALSRDTENGLAAAEAKAGYPGSVPRLVTTVSSLLAIALGALGLAGVVLHIPGLRSFLPGHVAMVANTAVSLMVLGVSLLTLRRTGPAGSPQRTAQAACLLIALLGLLSFLEFLGGWDFGIDQLLVSERPAEAAGSVRPGLMSPLTAVAEVLLGLSLAFLDVKLGRIWPAHGLALGAAAFLSFGIFDFLYASAVGHTYISINTAVALFGLCFGVVCARTTRGLGALLASPGMGGTTVRALLPATLIVPAAIGYFRWVSHDKGLFSEWFGVTLTSVSATALLSGLAVWTAFVIERSDAERKKSAEEVRDQAALLNLAHDAIFVRDLDSRISFWSRGASDTYGWSAAEACGRISHELLHTTFRIPLEAIESALRQRGEWEGELQHRKRDGSTIVVASRWSLQRDKAGNPKAVLEINRDITEPKRAEQAVRDSEQAFRTLADLVPQFVWMCSPDGLNTYFNQRWVDYTGMTLDESYGPGWSTPFHPEDKQAAWDAWNHSTASGDTYRVESRLRAADGSYRWFLMRGVPLRDDAGRIVKWFGTCTDIEDLKRAEQEIHRLNQQLQQKVEARTAELQRIEWMLAPARRQATKTPERLSTYDDVTKLNTTGLILESVGPSILHDITADYMGLLETSAAVYEKGGDYAYGIFSSGWCQFLNEASWRLCNTRDSREALACGRWHCHESCWTKATLPAIQSGQPVDVECSGGIRLYAVPVRAGDEIIGGINFGYGDPPSDEAKLGEIAAAYQVDIHELRRQAEAYESRPPYIIDLAKNRLLVAARLIGEIVQRKRAEQQLRQRTAELQAIFDTTPIGLAIAEDALALHIRGNPANERFLGVSSGAELSKGAPNAAPYRALKDGRELSLDQLPMQRAARGEIVCGDVIDIQRPDGLLVTTYASAVPLYDEQHHTCGAVGAFVDITEQKRAERELQERTVQLQESERRVRRKLDSILVPEGDLGRLELTDILDVPAIQELLDNFYSVVHVTTALIDRDGNILAVVGWQNICSQFHRVHPEACKNCVESDRLLSSGVAEGQFRIYKCKNHLWDVATPIMIGGQHMGNLFCGQFFFDDEAIDYEVFRQQAKLYGFDESQYLAALDQVPRLSRQAVNASMAFLAKLATIISQLSYSSVKLARSIEEKSRINGQLAASISELEAFTYSVSHDLRAPLRHIGGFSRILLEEFKQQVPPQAQHHLERIAEGTQRMGILVDDLLNLARVGRHELHTQPTELDSIVEQVCTELKPECEGRQVKWKIGRLPLVECDPGLMKQVFQNLISNALKFTRPRTPAVIEIGVVQENGPTAIFVRDNGVGFSMKYADKLFGVFQRLHRSEDFEGTGVGLATVQRIVRKHGGTIWADAELDKGAVFYFTIATADAAGEKAEAAVAGG